MKPTSPTMSRATTRLSARIADLGSADLSRSERLEFLQNALIDKDHELRKLEETNFRLEAICRQNALLLYTISNELRTPMNPVIGFADLLASNPGIDDESKEMASMIFKSGQGLLALMDAVLDYSKVAADQLKLTPEPLDLHDLLIELENALYTDAELQGIWLNFAADILISSEVYLDRLRVHQVFRALVQYAMKREGVSRIDLFAGLAESADLGHQGRLKFMFQCDGAPLSDFERKHLFLPLFETADEPKLLDTGLTMATAAMLIEKMHGEIVVHEDAGTGMMVDVLLPFIEVAGI